jgi:hypothetical protein
MHIGATQLGLNTSAGPATPDHFTNKSYSRALTLTDAASGAKGVLTFTGLVNGTLSIAGASINNSFTGPTTGTLTLGGNLHTVKLDSFTAPTLTTNGGFGFVGPPRTGRHSALFRFLLPSPPWGQPPGP